jgi:hypothetical protein
VEFNGLFRAAIAAAILGTACYLAFLVLVDVPMYLARWEHDVAAGKALLGVLAGLHDAGTRWTVTQDIAHWRDEMAWMGLYFSVAVWSSLALCSVDLFKDRLPHYRSRAAGFAAAQRHAVRA